MDDFFKTLLKSCYTKTALMKAIKEVEDYLNSKLFGGNTPLTTDYQLLTTDKTLDSITPQTFPDFIKNLKKSAEENPLATLTTAVSLPDEEVAKLCQNLRSSTLPNLVLDMKVSPELLGGMTLIYKGVVHDYSLKKKVNEQKQAILASFKGYIH